MPLWHLWVWTFTSAFPMQEWNFFLTSHTIENAKAIITFYFKALLKALSERWSLHSYSQGCQFMRRITVEVAASYCLSLLWYMLPLLAVVLTDTCWCPFLSVLVWILMYSWNSWAILTTLLVWHSQQIKGRRDSKQRQLLILPQIPHLAWPVPDNLTVFILCIGIPMCFWF